VAKPSLASQKKVTAENLIGLGVERLADILVEVAETRADLKRRLRMELAAGLGAVHLVPEIDKRLGALETSRGAVTWRQKPAFLRDLDAVRALIVDRLAPETREAARERLWRFMAAYGATSRRLPERDPAFETIYGRAAGDLGGLLATQDAHLAANALVDAAAAAPQPWAAWMPKVMAQTPSSIAAAALSLAQARALAAPGWIGVLRAFADAAADVVAYRDTYGAAAQETPPVAVAVARRWLAIGEVGAAGQALRLAAPKPKGLRGRLPAPDFDWESAWIDYLGASGDAAGAQAVLWASFQRTLDVDRAKAYVSGFSDFDDVEAESRVLAYASAHADVDQGLAVLMAWPALAEASGLILARGQEAKIDPERAEAWAAKLRKRFPAAAERLLRRGAAIAFKQRAFTLSRRLTEEADAFAS
jgi:hypothetical protein